MDKFDEISFEEFKDNFEPIQNFMDDEAGMSGILFDIYGDELEYIKEESSAGNVWTLIQKHDDRYILEGFHITNRVGYIITSIVNTDINTKLKVVFEPQETTPEQPQTEATQTDSSLWQKIRHFFR